MQFSDLPGICKGQAIQSPLDRPIDSLVIDSRKAIVGEGSLFFAIRGDRHDGHVFLPELYHLGLRQFVIESDIDTARFPEANILRVSSAVDALQKIAAAHRRRFHFPVVAVTGSNGKTIVKEWLAQVLSNELHVVKNPGSYNSQVGVPLSVWEMAASHELGIFEAGISKSGEMKKLEAIIQPTFGIFTNLGTAHDQGFESPVQKAEEKSNLFAHCERVVYCKDHTTVGAVLTKKQIPSFTWGSHVASDVRVSHAASAIKIEYGEKNFTLSLPFEDKGLQENALHIVAFLLMRGYDADLIQDRVQQLHAIPMRLEVKQGVNRSLVIDDTYNNDLAGLHISLDFLKNQQKPNKTLILSDVLQSGLSAQELIRRIKELSTAANVKRFIGIGPVLSSHQSDFPGSLLYPSTENFLDNLQTDSFADEVILVKGARPFQFERIVKRLQRKVHGTSMEVDLGAMVHNLNFFKSKLNRRTKLMGMVKAFAYGSGSESVANLLQYHRVDYLGVAYADEGIDLRRNNITIPIMVMNPSEESFPLLLEHHLEPEIYSPRILKSFVDFIGQRPIRIHLKLDTGMHRLGFEEEELDQVLEILLEKRNIEVASVFSHLSGADESIHDNFSREQAESFVRMADKVEKRLSYRPLRHLLNSPGILRLPQFQFDMVRLGIGLYGVDPTENGNADLKPVATLKTVLSQIKEIRPGDSIGYGRAGKTDRKMKLGTLAIGYADGYSRAFSRGKGKVLIHGKLAPVVGNVCMDMTMVDITGLDAREGDEAIIFGPSLPIREVASWVNTIPYELLTATSERVKRIFYADSI